MKNLLQLLLNLYIWFYISFSSFFGILWYGKLPKVSLYHWINKGSLYKTKDIYNDVNCQVVSIDDVPTRIKHKIIENYISNLYDNEYFISNISGIELPLFNGKEVYGLVGVISILEEVKNNGEYLGNREKKI